MGPPTQIQKSGDGENTGAEGTAKMSAPFAFIVENKFEDPMAVWCAEGDGVFARRAGDWMKPCTDVRVEHCEFELEIVNFGIWLPQSRLRVVARDVGGVHLQTTSGMCRDHKMK